MHIDSKISHGIDNSLSLLPATVQPMLDHQCRTTIHLTQRISRWTPKVCFEHSGERYTICTTTFLRRQVQAEAFSAVGVRRRAGKASAGLLGAELMGDRKFVSSPLAAATAFCVPIAAWRALRRNLGSTWKVDGFSNRFPLPKRLNRVRH